MTQASTAILIGVIGGLLALNPVGAMSYIGGLLAGILTALVIILLPTLIVFFSARKRWPQFAKTFFRVGISFVVVAVIVVLYLSGWQLSLLKGYETRQEVTTSPAGVSNTLNLKTVELGHLSSFSSSSDFTFDSKSLRAAYVKSVGQGEAMFINDGIQELQVGGVYEKVMKPIFSEDGKHFAFLAKRGAIAKAESVVVLDGQEGVWQPFPYSPLLYFQNNLLVHASPKSDGRGGTYTDKAIYAVEGGLRLLERGVETSLLDAAEENEEPSQPATPANNCKNIGFADIPGEGPRYVKINGHRSKAHYVESQLVTSADCNYVAFVVEDQSEGEAQQAVIVGDKDGNFSKGRLLKDVRITPRFLEDDSVVAYGGVDLRNKIWFVADIVPKP